MTDQAEKNIFSHAGIPVAQTILHLTHAPRSGGQRTSRFAIQ